MPFDAFVDPSGRLGPLRRFPGGPACGLLAIRREPTWVYCSSLSSSTVGAGGGESKIKVLLVCIGSSAPTW